MVNAPGLVNYNPWVFLQELFDRPNKLKAVGFLAGIVTNQIGSQISGGKGKSKKLQSVVLPARIE